jgi:hypothetical protein
MDPAADLDRLREQIETAAVEVAAGDKAGVLVLVDKSEKGQKEQIFVLAKLPQDALRLLEGGLQRDRATDFLETLKKNKL